MMGPQARSPLPPPPPPLLPPGSPPPGPVPPRDDGWTMSPAERAALLMDRLEALLAAVRRRDMGMVQHMLAAGQVPVDMMEDHTGDTALLLACRLGLDDVAQVCLAAGARNDPHPSFGQTALQAAVGGRHPGCVAAILQEAAHSGADAVIVNHMDASKRTPLHVAALTGQLPILDMLLVHGADVRLLDADGGTALHAAVAGGHGDCLAYLLDNGADVVLDVQDKRRDTALHLAAAQRREDCARLLLETCADPNLVNAEGFTPRGLAASLGDLALAELIEAFGGRLAPPLLAPAGVGAFLPQPTGAEAAWGGEDEQPAAGAGAVGSWDPGSFYPPSARDAIREGMLSARGHPAAPPPAVGMVAGMEGDLFAGLAVHEAAAAIPASAPGVRQAEEAWQVEAAARSAHPLPGHNPAATKSTRHAWAGRGRGLGVVGGGDGSEFGGATDRSGDSSLDGSLAPPQLWPATSPYASGQASGSLPRRRRTTGESEEPEEVGSVLFESVDAGMGGRPGGRIQRVALAESPAGGHHGAAASNNSGSSKSPGWAPAALDYGPEPAPAEWGVEWQHLTAWEQQQYGMGSESFYLLLTNEVWDVLYTEEGFPLRVAGGDIQEVREADRKAHV